jgi:flavin reductase (DIM6/NTAB) family NADH-FMN oxidoreductase RutF
MNDKPKQQNKKRKPWNAVDEQVYSISSLSEDKIPNMNIATYIVPVTMTPKRYMIAVYRNTKTHENIFKTKKPFLIQALSASQIGVVKNLGKKSGIKQSKEKYISTLKPNLYESLAYLPESAFVLYAIPESYSILGDHDIVIANIKKVIVNNSTNFLTTKHLQYKKIIG